MLTTVDNIRLIPGLSTATVSDQWLNLIVASADEAIKKWCKRDLEMTAYTEYYDGNGQYDIILRQRPVWSGLTSIAAGSNGAVLPQATISVESTEGFHPGILDDPNAPVPSLSIQTGTQSDTVVTYTGKTATTFTGCSGGTGTLATGYEVSSPVVFFDPAGYYGQAPSPYNQQTQLRQGTNYAVMIDGERVSKRGLLRRIGGNVGSWWGSSGYSYGQSNIQLGKLAAARIAGWPVGFGNLKVQYTAGYAPDKIPADLQYACGALCATMIRTQPIGANLQSENLGSYSYTVLAAGDNPEMGDVRRILARYREVSQFSN